MRGEQKKNEISWRYARTETWEKHEERRSRIPLRRTVHKYRETWKAKKERMNEWMNDETREAEKTENGKPTRKGTSVFD